MSLKFKKILENKRTDIQDFADNVFVTTQTIRNWCRKKGTIPNVDLIYNIANYLEEPPVTIAKAFVDRPDDLPPEEQGFQFHDHSDWFLPSDKEHPAESLAGFLKIKHITGSGVIRYNQISWSFVSVVKAVRDIVTIDYDYTNSQYKELKEYLGHTFNCIGYLFTDKYANLISLGIDQIEWWKILSYNYGSINLEMSIKIPIFEEMELDISENKKCLIQVYIFNEIHEHVSSSYFLPERKDVIKMYMKDLRGTNTTQKEFANAVNALLSDEDDHDIDWYTISKWENGKVVPTLKQMYYMCLMKRISFEKMLECYYWKIYREGFLSEEMQIYNIGLNLLYSKVENSSSFHAFLKSFLVTHATSEIPLYISETEDFYGIRLGRIFEIDNNGNFISTTYVITNILLYNNYFEIRLLDKYKKLISFPVIWSNLGIYATTHTNSVEYGFFTFEGKVCNDAVTRRFSLELYPRIPG